MVILITLLTAGAVAALLVGARLLVSTEDSAGQPRWFIDHAPTWLTKPLGVLDRRFIGGAAVGLSFIVIFSSAAVVGWIFSGLDNGRGFARWDVAAAEFGRDNATTTSTRVLGAITDLGGTVYLIAAMVLIGVYHSVRHADRGPLWYLGAVGGGVILLNNGLKLIVDRDRPVIAQLAGHAGSSFPSGHSAAAAACWAAIALVLARRRPFGPRIVAGCVAVFIACAVAATRVLLGVHWLTDVIAGVVVGWAWFAFVTVVFGGRSLLLGQPAELLADGAAENGGVGDDSAPTSRRVSAKMSSEKMSSERRGS